MLIVGVDPGKTGGFAVFDTHLDTYLFAVPLPKTEQEIADTFRETLVEFQSVEGPGSVLVGLERVRSSPNQGVVSAFTFGEGYGFLKGWLQANSIDTIDISPQKWQTFLGCRTGGDKKVTRKKALELFPKLKKSITHKTADALLICEYTRLTCT